MEIPQRSSLLPHRSDSATPRFIDQWPPDERGDL